MTPTSEGEKAFDAIRHYVTTTIRLWQLYGQIYCQEDNTVLMNDIAPGFFAAIQQTLANEVMRRLGALSDPAEGRGGKDKNLSLLGLMSILGIDPRLTGAIGTLHARFAKATGPIVAYRHKMIGHFDLPTAVGEVPTPPVVLFDVLEAMDCLPTLTNAIEMAAFNCSTSYECPIAGGGSSILHAIQQAKRYRDLHIEHFYKDPSTLDTSALLARIKTDHQ